MLSRCELALPAGEDAAYALTAYSEREERLGAEERPEARLLLWKATGDRAHLEVAMRLLDDALWRVPDEHHESMCRNLRVNREILAASSGESGEKSDDDAPRGNAVGDADRLRINLPRGVAASRAAPRSRRRRPPPSTRTRRAARTRASVPRT